MAEVGKKKKLVSGRHLSAIKRQRQNEKRRVRNKGIRSRLRTAMKNVRVTPTAEELKNVIPLLDGAVTKGIMPRRRASRLISRLTQFVNKAAS